MSIRWLWLFLPVTVWALKPVEDEYSRYRDNVPLNMVFTYGKDGVRSGDRWLTKRVYSRAYRGDIVDAARAFLKDSYALFRIDADNLKVVKIDRDDRTEAILFNQTYRGIPVYAAQVKLVRHRLTKRFTFVSSRYMPGIHLDDLKPVISSSQAYTIARSHLPVKNAKKYFEPELVVFPRGKGILAYRVQLPSDDPMGDWEIFVDAKTGKVFFVRDRAFYAHGFGKAWIPDPLTTSHHRYGDTPDWRDNNDADNDSLNNQRMDVILKDITFDGTYYRLDGPWVHLDESMESPNSPLPALTDSSAFVFTRSQQEFEAVMVYFHIDSMQRYFQNRLGITNANAEPQDVDPHGLDGADNSHYIPSTDQIAFGEGGVDDAEDADVIVHEYGHAVQDDIVPGWGSSTEARSMGEGFGDYLATIWSMRVDTFRWADVFTWDGHNEFWSGRNCDNSMTYPDSLNGAIHHDGQLWCASLVEVIWALHNEMGLTLDSALRTMDFLVIKHHFYLTSGATMPEAAQAIIQVDRDYNGGAHLGIIIPIFDARGLINAEDYLPVIYHEPLGDTEDLTGPYDVYAVVQPSSPPLDSVVLRYWTSLDPTEQSIQMTNTVGDTFHAQIPGPGSVGDVYYYILATDQNGTSSHPSGAPSSYHSFHVGPDTILPVIVHTPIGPGYPAMRWPATVRATVTDNLDVDSVWVEWSYNGTSRSPFTLTPVSGHEYEAQFPLSSVNVGDTISYRILAVDASSSSNLTQTDEYTFAIIDALGVVLVINDDDGDRKTAKNGYEKSGITFATGETADSIASWLGQMGYVVTLEDVSETDTSTWSSYDFLVWSSGEDTRTVADAQEPYSSTMIQALTNYYNSGGKIFFEGGELGYDAQLDNMDFAQDILRITDWYTDNPGDLLVAASTHPIATTPNALPSTISRNDGTSGYGDGDGLQPDASAVVVFNVAANSSYVGLVTSPDGRVVFLSTNFLSIADWDVAYALLENIASFLMNIVGNRENGSLHPGIMAEKGRWIIRFSAPVMGDVSLKVYSAGGRLVFDRDFRADGATSIVMDMQLPSGVYFYRVRTSDGSFGGKIVHIR